MYLWDGSTWTAFGTAVDANIYSIAAYLTDVYVSGLFTDAGNYIAKYSGGEWWALDTGLDARAGIQLHQSNDNVDVYVGGVFTTAGDKPANGVAVYYNN